MKTKRHQIFSTRCSPRKVFSVVSNLEACQSEAIRRCGFGRILDVKARKLQRELLEKLVKSFNLEESTIKAYGLEVHISAKDFERIMGVPEGGTDIILNGEEVEGRSEELEPFRVFSTRECGRQAISTSLMKKELSKMKDSDDLFLQMFILYVMGVLLVPTRREDISLSSVYAVTDVADIPKKNWASFCFNELVKCICDHNASKREYIPGCLLFLELIFLEHANGIFQTVDGSLDLMSWGSGDVELLLTKVVSSSSGKRSAEDAGLKSPPRKRGEVDGKRHKPDGDELLLYERIDARFSTMEGRIDNFGQEFRVAMGDAASRDNELMSRVVKMENEFRAFRDEIGTAVKSLIEAVKATVGDPLSREQPREPISPTAELKKNDQKGEVEKPREPISPTLEFVKTAKVENSGEAEGEIGDERCSESPSVKVVKKSPCKQPKASQVEKFILLSDESVAANDGCSKAVKGRKGGALRSVSKLKPSLYVLSPFERANPRAKKAQPLYRAPPFVVETPLSLEAVKMLQFAFSSELPESDTLVSVGGGVLSLSREDFVELLPRTKISTRIIEMACLCKTLEERSCGRTGGLSWFFPPQVSERASHCNEEQFMAKMRSYKIHERYCIGELLYCSKIHVPIFNLTLKHFYLAVFNMEAKEIEIWDSLRGTHNEEYDAKMQKLKLGLDWLLKDDICGAFSFVDFVVRYRQDVACQPNGFDCGLFVSNYLLDPDRYSKKLDQFHSEYERAQFTMYLLTTDLNEVKATVKTQSDEYFERHARPAQIETEKVNFKTNLLNRGRKPLHAHGEKKGRKSKKH